MSDVLLNQYGVDYHVLDDQDRRENLEYHFNIAMQQDEVWVFAFGSLMWNPGFDFHTRTQAVLDNYARQFTIWTMIARGTPENPGLGLCLEADTGKACKGYAYQLKHQSLRSDFDVLWEREMTSGVYQPVWLKLQLLNISTGQATKHVKALTFVVNQNHPHYAGAMAVDKMAIIMAKAKGKYGLNVDYLSHMIQEMSSIGDVNDAFNNLLSKIHRITDKC